MHLLRKSFQWLLLFAVVVVTVPGELLHHWAHEVTCSVHPQPVHVQHDAFVHGVDEALGATGMVDSHEDHATTVAASCPICAVHLVLTSPEHPQVIAVPEVCVAQLPVVALAACPAVPLETPSNRGPPHSA